MISPPTLAETGTRSYHVMFSSDDWIVGSEGSEDK